MNQSLKQASDQALVLRFRDGDQSAIAELICRYQSNVYSSIYYLVKDKYVAEDLFQDTFLKIMHHLRKDKYEEQGKFLPWTLRIAHNLCIDHFRKVKQQTRITTADGVDFFSRYVFNERDAATNMIQQQTEYTVQRLIDELPVEQKEVVLLRVYGALSFKEIAAITGVSINTALGRMRYALNNMRRLIRENNLVLR